MKFAKKSKINRKFQKNEGYFFGQHPLVEKSPSAPLVSIILFCLE